MFSKGAAQLEGETFDCAASGKLAGISYRTVEPSWNHEGTLMEQMLMLC